MGGAASRAVSGCGHAPEENRAVLEGRAGVGRSAVLNSPSLPEGVYAPLDGGLAQDGRGR